ncbi:MAG: hypothetical protein J7497_09835 [Chitinophagaceae bacterium]|nr:hypothetical protein [Chitinophagaceae bacterium]
MITKLKKMTPFSIFKKTCSLFVVYMFFAACSKDDFTYEMIQGDNLTIDSIAFSTGSPLLIADGQSALEFIIQAYSKRKVTINGVETDSMVLIPEDRIPESEKKVFDNNGIETGHRFSTTSTTPATVSFYAKIGNVQSATQAVNITAPGTAYSKIVIPVVFHVFELNKTDSKRYPWYLELKHEKLEELVNGLNGIFNRQGTNAPNGASANIEFVLATTDPAGRTLEKPGHNIYGYPSTFDWGWASFNAVTLVKENADALLWDPTKYLNVWVLPSVVYYGGLTTTRPAYTLATDPLPGIDMQQVSSASEVPLTEPEGVGLMIGRDELNSTLRAPAPNLAYRFGTFYGLFQTYTYDWDPSLSDYCNDTQKFSLTQYRDIYKKSPEGILFRAQNIMDATFIDWNVEGGQNLVSRVNTISADQAARIRYVVENCPERMARQ